ncbi:MAG: chalcone-flavanone isomerase-domain-containing protein [Benjaminiella poitrasii]|nr:MAG: chalcone-flavanone isomerase-domain-containing protein [Benjaminiella poitrasii]
MPTHILFFYFFLFFFLFYCCKKKRKVTMFRLSSRALNRLPRTNKLGHVTPRLLPSTTSVRSVATVACKVPTTALRNRFLLGGCAATGAAFFLYSQQKSDAVVYAEAPPPAADTVEDPATNISFPLYLRMSKNEKEWKMLVGLGVRSVSFLNMNVYVVGLYMKTDDMDKLRKLAGWKEFDKSKFLTDSELAEQFAEQPYDLSIRLVPTRATNTQHLRDGFLRNLMQRMKDQQLSESEEKEVLAALQDFKSNFVSMRVKKETVFVFTKTAEGGLKMEYEGRDLGTVMNPWLAKNFIMTYLNPQAPSSPAALNDIAEGFERLMKN